MNEKLIQLAFYLENEVPDDKFDMSQWSSECGTIACALGWGTRIFIGLVLVPDAHGSGEIGIKFTDHNHQQHHALHAATACFGIPYEEAGNIFFDNSYVDPTKANVIKRIREHALHS